MECKLEMGKALQGEAVVAEMVSQFREAEGRDLSEEELKEIRAFVESR